MLDGNLLPSGLLLDGMLPMADYATPFHPESFAFADGFTSFDPSGRKVTEIEALDGTDKVLKALSLVQRRRVKAEVGCLQAIDTVLRAKQ
jgi:hypothetical protein